MRALITGASSGIGRDMARELDKRGFDLVLVSRDKSKLEEVKSTLKGNAKLIPMDLSDSKNCKKLHEMAKDIDFLINNAGFGTFGEFAKTDLDKEIDLINTNITAVHILTKLFAKKFTENNKGYILNVSSVAGLMPAGPLLSSYYASKAYVRSLSLALNEELISKGANVYVSVLCPGPVNTEFNNRAGVKFAVNGISPKYTAQYAIKKMFDKKAVIIPSFNMRVMALCSRFIPQKAVIKICHGFQKKKEK